MTTQQIILHKKISMKQLIYNLYGQTGLYHFMKTEIKLNKIVCLLKNQNYEKDIHS